MRASKRRLVLGALIVTAFAVLWTIAASRLWRSHVPGDLNLPHTDPSTYFTSSQLERARNYERFVRIDFLLSQIVLIGVLAAYAARGARFARESAAGRIGTGMLLGMLGFALVWIAELPFGAAELWWERRHGVSRQGYLDWIVGSWLGLGSEFLFICLAIVIVMALAGWLRHTWWIAGAPVFAAIFLVAAFLQPYLIGNTHPLRNARLAGEARQLARAEGVSNVPVRVQKVHRYTTEPNAAATGLGPSRRVILWDTLLDGRFSPRQVRVVLAHELGHLSRHHIWKGVLWFVLFAFPIAFVLALATRSRGGLYEARAVPLALLVLVVVGLLALPLQNLISRRIESEADWVALQTTRDPAAARGLFQRFSTVGLEQPDPPSWAYVFLANHPTIVQRIAMANAWQARHRAHR